MCTCFVDRRNDLLIGMNFDDYLDTMEIVNAPNFCTHNLIADKNGNRVYYCYKANYKNILEYKFKR